MPEAESPRRNDCFRRCDWHASGEQRGTGFPGSRSGKPASVVGKDVAGIPPMHRVGLKVLCKGATSSRAVNCQGFAAWLMRNRFELALTDRADDSRNILHRSFQLSAVDDTRL